MLKKVLPFLFIVIVVAAYAQNVMWGDGIPIVTGNYMYYYNSIKTSNESIAFIWSERSLDNRIIMTQRINPNGEPQFDEPSLLISEPGNFIEVSTIPGSDNSLFTIIENTDTSEHKLLKSNENGELVYSLEIPYNSIITSDDNGGVFIVYGNDIDEIYLNHLNAEGLYDWDEGIFTDIQGIFGLDGSINITFSNGYLYYISSCNDLHYSVFDIEGNTLICNELISNTACIGILVLQYLDGVILIYYDHNLSRSMIQKIQPDGQVFDAPIPCKEMCYRDAYTCNDHIYIIYSDYYSGSYGYFFNIYDMEGNLISEESIDYPMHYQCQFINDHYFLSVPNYFHEYNESGLTGMCFEIDNDLSNIGPFEYYMIGDNVVSYGFDYPDQLSARITTLENELVNQTNIRETSYGSYSVNSLIFEDHVFTNFFTYFFENDILNMKDTNYNGENVYQNNIEIPNLRHCYPARLVNSNCYMAYITKIEENEYINLLLKNLNDENCSFVENILGEPIAEISNFKTFVYDDCFYIFASYREANQNEIILIKVSEDESIEVIDVPGNLWINSPSFYIFDHYIFVSYNGRLYYWDIISHPSNMSILFENSSHLVANNNHLALFKYNHNYENLFFVFDADTGTIIADPVNQTIGEKYYITDEYWGSLTYNNNNNNNELSATSVNFTGNIIQNQCYNIVMENYIISSEIIHLENQIIHLITTMNQFYDNEIEVYITDLSGNLVSNESHFLLTEMDRSVCITDYKIIGNNLYVVFRASYGTYDNVDEYFHYIQKIDISDYVGTNDNIVPAREFAVNAYPNPFNPNLTISYSLPADSDVSIDIYNLKGQKVTSLLNERIKAGEHQLVWNGKDNRDRSVGSGVYFYKVRAGNLEKTNKIILMK